MYRPCITNWKSLTRWWRWFLRALSSRWWMTKFEKHTSISLMRTTLKLTKLPNRCGQSPSSEAYWPSFRCEWSDINVAVHCSSFISGRRDVLSYWGPRFHFPRECLTKWMWHSLVLYFTCTLQSPCWSARAAESWWQQSHARTTCNSSCRDEHTHNKW